MSRALLGSVNISVKSSKMVNRDYLKMLQQRIEKKKLLDE